MDDLGSSYSLVVALDELVAFGKTSFSEELSFDVLPVADLTVLMLDPLLYDRCAGTCSRMEIGLAAAVLRGVHDGLHLRGSPACAWSLGLSAHVATMKWLTTIEIRHIK